MKTKNVGNLLYIQKLTFESCLLRSYAAPHVTVHDVNWFVNKFRTIHFPISDLETVHNILVYCRVPLQLCVLKWTRQLLFYQSSRILPTQELHYWSRYLVYCVVYNSTVATFWRVLLSETLAIKKKRLK